MPPPHTHYRQPYVPSRCPSPHTLLKSLVVRLTSEKIPRRRSSSRSPTMRSSAYCTLSAMLLSARAHLPRWGHCRPRTQRESERGRAGSASTTPLPRQVQVCRRGFDAQATKPQQKRTTQTRPPDVRMNLDLIGPHFLGFRFATASRSPPTFLLLLRSYTQHNPTPNTCRMWVSSDVTALVRCIEGGKEGGEEGERESERRRSLFDRMS